MKKVKSARAWGLLHKPDKTICSGWLFPTKKLLLQEEYDSDYSPIEVIVSQYKKSSVMDKVKEDLCTLVDEYAEATNNKDYKQALNIADKFKILGLSLGSDSWNKLHNNKL